MSWIGGVVFLSYALFLASGLTSTNNGCATHDAVLYYELSNIDDAKYISAGLTVTDMARQITLDEEMYKSVKYVGLQYWVKHSDVTAQIINKATVGYYKAAKIGVARLIDTNQSIYATGTVKGKYTHIIFGAALADVNAV